MAILDRVKSINKTARFAGFLYLLMLPFSIFGFFYVPSTIIVPGDAATTASNIVASEWLFRSGIVSWLIGQMIFVVLLVVLYKLFKPVNKNYALLMIVLALVAVPIAFVIELAQYAALLLLSGADFSAAFETDQLHALVMFFLDLHEHGVYIAQIFWGLWLFPLGYLVFKSGFLPRFLGVLLIIGGFGYVIDSFTFFLFPKFDISVAQFTFVGELLLPLWLVIKGVNVEQWEKRTFESA